MKYITTKLFLITILSVLLYNTSYAQSAAIPGDFADPSIIRTGSGYYAVGTSSEWAPHFPIYKSTDLKSWKQAGYVFDKAPEWTSGSFWAPEYYFMNNAFYIYYTARRKADGRSYIGVAESKYPDRGFVDHGVIIEHGKEAIDGFVFNDNGQKYITFKAYGLESRPIEILGVKLSADGLKTIGEPFTMLRDDEGIGMEGQSIMKKDGYYYLFYSSGNCCGGGCSYNVSVARSRYFKGPYQKYSHNPLLQGNQNWKCTGHGTSVNAPGNKTYYLYHAYSKATDVFTGRQGMLAELTWSAEGGWPVLTQLPVTSGGHNTVNTSFNEKALAPYWQWDFRNGWPKVKQEGGTLSLSGTVKQSNQTGVVLTVRPVSANFDVTTTVVNNNTALKGLAFYGDANAAVGVGVVNNLVEFWMVKDNKRSVIGKKSVNNAIPVELKLTLRPDKTCRVFYRQNNGEWQEVGIETDISFLPQWDRSPRVGLHFKGDSTMVARFSAFSVVNH